MKYLKLAPAALVVFSAAACANMFDANTYDVSNLNQEAIESRLSMAGPLFDGWNRTFKQGDPWVEAYGFTHRINKAGDFGKFKNKGAALSLGYDHVIAQDFRLGLALNGGAGRLKANEMGIKSNSRWFGANVYGTWTGKRVNVIANVGYTHEKDKSKTDWLDDHNGHTINAGLRFETSFVAGGISFVPYYGVRFTHVASGHVNLKGVGADAKVRMSDANIWQFPVGVNAGYEFTCGGGWKTRTMADLSIIPTAGKRKTYFNYSDSDGYFGSFSSRFANSVTYLGKLGLQTTKGQHSFGLQYGAGAGAHGSLSQQLTLNYQFMY